VLNIQPVMPVNVTDELNLITRPIIPVIRQPDLVDGGDTWGLADSWAKSTCAWSPGGVSKRTSKTGVAGGRSSRSAS
jgi:hypothetical protein